MHKLCIAIRLALTGIPYRRRPGGIAGMAKDHMNMQLRYDIA